LEQKSEQWSFQCKTEMAEVRRDSWENMSEIRASPIPMIFRRE
jgi:hypothetical protein